MISLRTTAERLSRNRIIKRNIVVGGTSVPIFVSPDAQLKYLKIGVRAFDPDLIRIAEQYLFPTSNVWDVGANVGVFTFAASVVAYSGTVVAIEPDTWLVSILRRTAASKPFSSNKICVVPVAISDTNSIATFLIAARGRASSALEAAGGRSEMGGVRERQYVPTVTLDTMLNTFPAPNFVKMDIEGAEYLALQGAHRLINEVRPIFYIEVGRDVSTTIVNIFQSAGYMAYHPSGQDLEGCYMADACVANILFIPEVVLRIPTGPMQELIDGPHSQRVLGHR